MGLVSELRRRNVFRMAALYVVAAWLTMQVAEVLIALAKLPDSIGPTTLILLAVGLPIALVFSWFFEVTPEGVSLEKDVTPGESITHVTGRRLDFLVIALMAAALMMFGYDKWSAPEVPEKSIAVLPFVNMSNDPSGEYLGDGIAEEILNELANLATLHVAARTSSFYFKGRNEPIPAIARQLGVSTVLEGSVRRAGDKIRITAQLINAANGYHLWSDTFDQEVGDIFAIQEEIAEAVRSALEVTVLGQTSSNVAVVNTESFDAYDYYLLGKHYREKRNPESLEKSIELFNKALQIDNRFAPGYTALAASHLYQAYYSDMSPERVVELTNPLIERSLELNPQLANAHAVRASVRLLVGDYVAADAGYRKALELRPNDAAAWLSLGFSLVRQSRLKEAAEAYARSESLDPLDASGLYNIGALRMLTGHFEDGLAAFEKVIALAPDRIGTEDNIAHWSVTYGHYEEAARWVVRLLEQRPNSTFAPMIVATIYGNVGMWDQAWESISLAREKAPDKIAYFSSAADLYWRSGDNTGLLRFVTDEFKNVDQLAPTRYSPTNKERYFWHGVAAISEGNYVQAIDDFTNSAGGPAGIENLVYDGITQIKYIAYALQHQGRDDEADELLRRCLNLATDALAQGWATPTIHYRTAQVYSMLGQPDDAIAQLQQAVDKGWRIAAQLEVDPLWYRLQDDVRFQEIVARVNNELSVQSERVEVLLDED
jgi:TolB-like protein/predicted TPR repeat methyltransferase